jgi:nicotinamidase-related amidase
MDFIGAGTLADSSIVLFVDHQNGIAEHACTARPHDVDEAASKLARAACLYGIPILVSAVAAEGEPKLTPALRATLNGAQIHVRGGTDSLQNAGIARAVEESGRKTLLIAGVLTEVAVQRPALSAIDRGYRVQVVLDACNGQSERSERAAILRMTQHGVEMTSLAGILGELAYDFEDPRATAALALLHA